MLVELVPSHEKSQPEGEAAIGKRSILRNSHREKAMEI